MKPQLRALCDSADSDAFLPISSVELTDQRLPSLILQLSSIVQASVDLAISRKIIKITKLHPQANWERIGRYARFSNKKGFGFWFGINFNLWRQHSCTPLWLVFSSSDFGRSVEVKNTLDSWAIKENIFTHFENDEFVVAIDISIGEEKDQVVKCIVDQLENIANVLSSLDMKGK